MTDEHATRFADALRAAADLVERGLVNAREVRIDYETVTEPNYRNSTMETRHTGWQTVTITMRGNPRDMSAAGWTDEQAALPAPIRTLPRTPMAHPVDAMKLYGLTMDPQAEAQMRAVFDEVVTLCDASPDGTCHYSLIGRDQCVHCKQYAAGYRCEHHMNGTER